MAEYFFQIAGPEYGPVPFSDLVAQVRSGEITADVLVRQTNSDAWSPAEEIPELFRQAKKMREESATDANDHSTVTDAAAASSSKRRRRPEASKMGNDVTVATARQAEESGARGK